MENAACCHRSGAFSQLLAAACDFQRRIEFLSSSFVVVKGISLAACLCLRPFDHSDVLPASVAEPAVVEGAALCHCLLALGF